MARIRLKRGDHQRGGLSAMTKELAELFANEVKRDHPDAIGATGELFAQVLALNGHQEEALAVLDQAESSYARVTNNAGVLQVRALRSAIACQSGPEQEATAAPLAEHQDKC